MSARTAIEIILVVALALGAWWLHHTGYQDGYAARDAIVLRDQVRAADQAIAKTQENVQAALATDEKLRTEAVAEKKAYDTRAQRLDRVQTTQEKPHAPQPPTAPAKPVLLGSSVLDLFTLCLLNAERDGAGSPAAACAPERTDAEVDAAAATPTEVGGGDLARNDLEVTRIYNDLAKRHDGLVEWVKANINKGRKTE
ncbi:hypothetical protein D9M72_92340 [compost metagenome]